MSEALNKELSNKGAMLQKIYDAKKHIRTGSKKRINLSMD